RRKKRACVLERELAGAPPRHELLRAARVALLREREGRAAPPRLVGVLRERLRERRGLLACAHERKRAPASDLFVLVPAERAPDLRHGALRVESEAHLRRAPPDRDLRVVEERRNVVGRIGVALEAAPQGLGEVGPLACLVARGFFFERARL